MMKLVCAWCGSGIERSGYDHKGASKTSHGMCPACSQALAFQERGVSLQEHIDSVPIPILMVDSNNKTLAVNSQASDILGKMPEAIVGHEFGEIFDCIHSHRPEGCGRSIHCSGCAIRRSVSAAFSTDEPQIEVPATVSVQSADRLSDVVFTVTTVRNGRFVILRIDQVHHAPSA